ncbi:Squalene/phytoene synthase, partial [Coniella lustricola]
LPSEPLYGLLDGFKTDAKFSQSSSSSSSSSPAGDTKVPATFPIATQADLHTYGSQVAGTVGKLCLALIAHHHVYNTSSSNTTTNNAKQQLKNMTSAQLEKVTAAANEMGIALQYVNIARDIAVDAVLGRVYIPTAWLDEVGLTPEMHQPQHQQKTLLALPTLRRRLLRTALDMYAHARPTMALLPREARRPMVVAVESYMEIARVLLEKSDDTGKPRRATVPTGRRLRVALMAL